MNYDLENDYFISSWLLTNQDDLINLENEIKKYSNFQSITSCKYINSF